MLEPAGTAEMGGQRAEKRRIEGRTRIVACGRKRVMPVAVGLVRKKIERSERRLRLRNW
jgi:hypothetical protein